jgi:hypothetical protein
MYPACSHVLRMALSIGMWVSSHAWLLVSQQDVLAPASIPCGLVLFESTVAPCSIASAPLRAFLNPYEFGSAVGSAMGSRASPSNACIALSFLVGIPRGRFVPFGFGLYTRRRGRVWYPRCRSWCLAMPVLTGSVQVTLALPGVLLPWFSVTRLTARALPLHAWVSTYGTAGTLCHLPAFVALTRRA